MDEPLARLFIAAYPPGAVARALLECVEALPALPAHRIVPEGDVHLTLYFVGARPREHVVLVPRALAPIARQHEPFPLTVDRLITLPERHPRLVAAAASPASELTKLHERLCHLIDERAPSGKNKMDVPHLTLCRFRRGERARPIDEPIEPLSFDITHIHLVESILVPSGAKHRIIESFDLGGPPSTDSESAASL